MDGAGSSRQSAMPTTSLAYRPSETFLAGLMSVLILFGCNLDPVTINGDESEEGTAFWA